MKEAMVASLAGSATQTSKAMDKIAEFISSFGKALGNGLAKTAMTIALFFKGNKSHQLHKPAKCKCSLVPLQAHISVRSRLLTCLKVLSILFFGNMTGTALQKTGKRYQNLKIFRKTSKENICVFDIVIFNISKFPIHLNNMFHCMKSFPADIYMLKVNNRNTRTRYEICSKLTIKTLE